MLFELINPHSLSMVLQYLSRACKIACFELQIAREHTNRNAPPCPHA